MYVLRFKMAVIYQHYYYLHKQTPLILNTFQLVFQSCFKWQDQCTKIDGHSLHTYIHTHTYEVKEINIKKSILGSCLNSNFATK